MTWEEIYKNRGEIQVKPIPSVVKAAKIFQGQDDLKVLDAGCGTGRHLRYLKKTFPKSDLFGFDSSQTALNHIAMKDLKKKLLDMNEGLPYEDGFFDLVLSVLVIEHGIMKQIIFNISELKRVVKDGGLVVFSASSVKDFRCNTGKEIESNTRIDTKQEDGNLPHHFFTSKEVEKLFYPFEVIYKKLERRPAVLAKGTSFHWEFIFKARKNIQ